MSTSSIAGAGAGSLSQLLASLFARVKDNEDVTSSTTTTTPISPSPAPTSGEDTSNAAPSQPTLSDQVIGALVALQINSDRSSDATSGSAESNPLSQTFTSIDTDGDGSISQSELEAAIEGAGGTADEADSVYSALGGTSTAGISESTFDDAAKAAAPQGGPGGAQGHHHHHGGGGGGTESASDQTQQVFSPLDTNQDGVVSEDELLAAFGIDPSQTASTTSDSGSNASSIFSAIDTDGNGSISQSELTTYLQSLQQVQNDPSTSNTFQWFANQSYSNTWALGANANRQVAMA